MGAKTKLKRWAIYLFGWGFIVLGILGLFLPILQGILFILIGLLLLSNVSPWAARLLHRLSQRFPRISRQLDEARSKAVEFQSKVGKKFDKTKAKAGRVHRKVFKGARGKAKEKAES